MNIAVDVAGGDHAPYEIIDGALAALTSLSKITITLLGEHELIREYIKDKRYDKERLCIVDAPETIGKHDTPAIAVKDKKKSTLVVGARLLRDKKCEALISAGNTGAVLASALLYTGRIRGVQRPALSPIIPTGEGHAMIIDGGANMDCLPLYLEQFALMGAIFTERVLGKKNPRVGLLNVGAEEEKGNDLTKEAHRRLKNMSGFSFIGNIEGRDVMDGLADVVVCDGFSGNILLKTIEGVGAFMNRNLRQVFSGFPGNIAGLLVMNKINKYKQQMSYEEYGGAPFLGIDGVVIKMHGTAKAKTVINSIRQAHNSIEHGVISSIKGQFESACAQSTVRGALDCGSSI